MADFLPYASEEEKRKAEAKSVLERQRLAAGQATSQASLASKLEERMRTEDERKKNERIAEAMGLSVQEKAAYLKANAPKPVDEETTVPTGAETAKGEEVKRAPTPPTAPSPQGVDGAKPSVTKPVTTGKESQATTTQAIAGVAKLADKVQASKSGATSKPTLDTLTGYLDNVAKDVNNDPRFNNTGIERDLLAARADAYKMYKEKADRNQLLGTVERAINAIAQFASAQAGFGTRQAGGALPLSTADYGGQTEQAFKEYQTEVGLLGEEQKAGERAKERGETAKEKEIGRRQKTIQEQIETERDVLKEAAAEKRARIGADSREEIAKLRAALPKAPSPGKLRDLDAQIKATNAAISSINKYAGAANSDAQKKALPGFLTATKMSPEQVDTEIKTRSAGIFTGPSKKDAAKELATEQIEKLRENLQLLRDRKDALLSGQATPEDSEAAAVPTVAPTGQPAASDGKVASREQVDAYASQYKMTPDAASKYLQSQGYTIGR